MRIAIKGRNLHVSERLKEHVDRRFAKVGRQVSELAELELELYEERNPANPNAHVAEALHAQGITIDRHKISVPDNIKSLGSYQVEVHLAKNVTAKTTI